VEQCRGRVANRGPRLMKKIVFISTVLPFPVDTGKRAVLSGILKYLCERYGADRVTYVLLGNPKDRGCLRTAMPCELLVVKRPSILAQLWSVLWFVFAKRDKSIQEAMLYSAGLGRELRALVGGLDPALVVCDTIRVGQFFEIEERPDDSYVLYMDDLFSVRYGKMLEVLARYPRAHVDPLGNFAQFVPSPLRVLAQPRSVQKWLLKAEQKRVEKRERACVKWFDKTLLINKEEADLLRRKTQQPSVLTIKPFLSSAGRDVTRRYDGSPVFIILGALNVPQNQFSVTHFLESQMDAIVDRIAGVRVRVIGRGATDELHRFASDYEQNVSVEGYVDDLDSVFSEACAMIVPLLFGSGVKIKTLEAIARGLPVISTTYGIEGIPVENWVNCVVEDDITRYPAAMSALLDIDVNAEMSRRAYKLYRENYSRDHLLQEYDAMFGGSLR
jgi:glycosyltransferase involved in cell wall biosynthesis